MSRNKIYDFLQTQTAGGGIASIIGLVTIEFAIFIATFILLFFNRARFKITVFYLLGILALIVIGATIFIGT